MKTIITKLFPSVLKGYHILKLGFQEKKILPNSIKLSHSNNRLYANPFEKRGLALLRNKGEGQPFIKKYWRLSNKLFNPEIVLDVGANYGEIFLDTNYPNTIKKVIAIEANPFLHDYLCRSKDDHPLKEKIEIINGLAGEENIKAVRFFIDKSSSGRSTALKNNFVKKSHEVTVNSHRIDDLILKSGIELKALLFKIDVEGFEPFVLNGMTGLFNSEIDLIGCIEFNLVSLQKNNIDINAYLTLLNKYFKTLILKKDGSLVSLQQLNIENISDTLSNKHIEGDIILFSNEKQLHIFKNNFELS